MELLTYVKELFLDGAQYVAGYKIGQQVLRQMDRALWVLEKTARWAVPPPLDQDERPQPELVRPLPWVFFLMLLIVLRISRETISIVNLFRGKPPLRSADVVMYIQSQRRYLRALKYQGSRSMRARQQQPAPVPWPARLRALLQFAMCARPARHGLADDGDEVVVVKHSTNGQEQNATAGDATMERLIEKMMTDMNTDSDDDSFTLTTVPSLVSDLDETKVTESEHQTTIKSNVSTSTPTKEENQSPAKMNDENISEITSPKPESTDNTAAEDALLSHLSNAAETPKSPNEAFIESEISEHEKNEQKQSPPKKTKIANGQANISSPKRKKGIGRRFGSSNQTERRDSDVPVVRITPADDSNNNETEVIRPTQQNDH